MTSFLREPKHQTTPSMYTYKEFIDHFKKTNTVIEYIIRNINLNLKQCPCVTFWVGSLMLDESEETGKLTPF